MSELGEMEVPEVIAVVGLAGRFPGARTVDELWQNLCGGVEAISFFTPEELIAEGLDPSLARAPNYIRARGVLGDTDQIDAPFFGLNAREAALMDPQHRLFLQCAWEAMEHAGYAVDRQPGRTGVFAGMSMNTYLLANLYGHVAHVASVDSLQASIGNDKDSLTTEVAYRLNLRGPAVTIQSSSSTSLTAVHYACQSLLGYECDMALAGGVSIHFPEKAGYLYYEGGTTSPDGHCRAFDARAAGFVAGHGAGVVVLRRLSDALASGDTIYAVVKGSAVNNDGSAKVSYMAPSVDGQAEVIALAQAVAGVSPESIGLVEAHGTATLMGDPIEAAALTQAFRHGTDKRAYCALGSIKSNIGHLDAAAGVTGFIKAVLALHHKQIPPTLHFETPNPQIDLAASPFFINTELLDWAAGPTPRRAGVTSLGMGGTNAHCVLEEAPTIAAAVAVDRGASINEPELLVLSARSDAALAAASEQLAAHLEAHPDMGLADVGHTLAAGRTRHARRRALVCRSTADAAKALRAPARWLDGAAASTGRPVMFMFSGQGSQYPDMGRGLYESEAVFRDAIDHAAERLRPLLGRDLRTLIFPTPATRDEAAAALAQTAITQPALFAVEHALARLWMSWGLAPRAMIGHSIGEYVAACLAGVFTVDDALALVAARGKLMQQLPAGAMLAVSLPEAQVASLLSPTVTVAVVNAASSCVVAGPIAAVAALAERLAGAGHVTTRLHTSHAFHSAMMDPILDAFRAEVARVARRPPTLPYLSNVSGTWITADEATSPDYWARHLRSPVRFADGLGELLADPDAILLEVGPGPTLMTFGRQHPSRRAEHLFVSSLRHPREALPDREFLLGALGRLWLAGVEPEWSTIHDEGRRRVALPTYPFERRRHWIDPKPLAPPAESATARLDGARWFHLPSWRRALPPVGDWQTSEGSWWIVAPQSGGAGARLAAKLAARLVEAGRDAVLVTPGTHYAALDDGSFTIDPAVEADWSALVEKLVASGRTPAHLVDLSGAVAGAEQDGAAAAQRGVVRLAHLVSALEGESLTSAVAIAVVTERMQALDGGAPRPGLAALLGPCRVLPQEYSNLACKAIDVALPMSGGWQEESFVEQLLVECASSRTGEAVIALRGGERWVEEFAPVPKERAGGPVRLRLRERGAYLIVGGLGTLGFAHAKVLAEQARARLVLVGRTVLPARPEWDDYLAGHDQRDPISERIRRARRLEEAGAEVHLAVADVGVPEQLAAAVADAKARYGQLSGAVFCAGTVDRGLFRALRDTTDADIAAQLHARVVGLESFAAAVAAEALDFCLVASSLASLLGGLGLFTYAAATNFMDAFARRQNTLSPTRWLSVNWDAWRSDVGADLGNPAGELAISDEEGGRAVADLFALGPPAGQIAVSTSSLTARAALWSQPAAAASKAPAEAPSTAPRPSLHTPFVAPQGEPATALAALWADMLGLAEVGVHDSFFELGGNSLVGVRLIASVRERFGVSIPTVSLYEDPTIAALARLIAAALGTAPVAPDEEEDASATRGARRRAHRQRQPAVDNSADGDA